MSCCSGYCRLPDRLPIHIQRITSSCRNLGCPIRFAARILHIPLVVVITVNLPALESLSALLESQRLNGQCLLAYSVCHRADLRRCRRAVCQMILNRELIGILPLCVEVGCGSGHRRLSYRLTVYIQCITAACRYFRCPVGLPGRILYIPLIIVITVYLPALERLAALLEAEGLDCQGLLAYTVSYGAGLIRCGRLIRQVVFNGELIRVFPLCIEVRCGSR